TGRRTRTSTSTVGAGTAYQVGLAHLGQLGDRRSTPPPPPRLPPREPCATSTRSQSTPPPQTIARQGRKRLGGRKRCSTPSSWLRVSAALGWRDSNLHSPSAVGFVPGTLGLQGTPPLFTISLSSHTSPPAIE